MTTSTARSSSRRDLSVLLVGGAIFAAGLLAGSLSSPGTALAQHGRGGTEGAGAASFGFGVPAQGFAVVKGADGGGYVVSAHGEATRVLVSVNPGAPDRPDAGRTGHLALD